MDDQSSSDGENRERLYRDVWGSEPIGRPALRRDGEPDRPVDETAVSAEEDPYPSQDRRAWEPGGRLRALELEVRELRAAIQSLQRSTKGSIGALRSSIRQLSGVLGTEPEPETRETAIVPGPVPTTPFDPDEAIEAQ